MPQESSFRNRSFNTFSGADIKAVFANTEIGTLQAISYAIQREKAPVYVMGDPNPRAFSRGKRGIAGSLIFIMFDDHALFETLEKAEVNKFVKRRNEFGPREYAENRTPSDFQFDPADGQEPVDESVFENNWGLADAYYVDQIPPFDVTIAAVNEMGATASMIIWGVEILNEGYGISVDDMVSEQQMTYVARAITRWRKGTRPWTRDFSGGGTKLDGPSIDSPRIT